jgi:arylsulfatase A-like enzyme
LFAEDPATRGLLLEGERASGHPGHGDFRPDARTAELALRYLERHEPRLLFIGLGEPDEYAHRNEYANYLGSLRAADELIGEVSRQLDALAARGANTALFVTTDHGRAKSFVSHGAAHPESSRIWLVAAGTGIGARGALQKDTRRYLSDIAPTIRELLELPGDAHPEAGRTLSELSLRGALRDQSTASVEPKPHETPGAN